MTRYEEIKELFEKSDIKAIKKLSHKELVHALSSAFDIINIQSSIMDSFNSKFIKELKEIENEKIH